MSISTNGMTVLEKRYLLKDEEGNPVETVEQLFRRVSNAIAAADKKFDDGADIDAISQQFYDMMINLDFLPNSPTLMNAGRDLGQLSACFVLPVDDSMEGIFDSIKNAALIHKSGGGTGFSFSRLRPSGASVNSTGGVASGPISFMKVFNAATEAVKQGGTRRGANMGILRVDHPDILEFIECKNDTSEINNFNLSVGITEDFMRAVKENQDYDLFDPKTKQPVSSLNAKDVFDKIVLSAWNTGEPGIIFLDRLNKDNPVPSQGEIESTNPCGEQPLLPYESCNLGSINLVRHLKETSSGFEIDMDKLKETVYTAVHFLDNVIAVNKYPLAEIERVTHLTRKIGLGVMGFADMLLCLGIPYNSDEGVQAARKIMKFINEMGHAASCALAQKRGTFPLYEESIYYGKETLRNATVTTIAPTGTLSIIADVSSGVEPVFAYAYIRNVMDDTHMIEVNEILKSRLIKDNLYSDDLMKEVIEKGSLDHVAGIPPEIKKVFVCAHDVSPIWHAKMQAAFQEFTDNAVSKTCNFANDASACDVAEVYNLAYSQGCKGVTIYRDGSRDSQVLNIGKVNDHQASGGGCLECAEANSIIPRPRPEITTGQTEKVQTGCGNLYITVNYDEQGICEVFTNTGRAGGCPSQSEATSRLVSIALRSGISTDALIEQLKGIRCPSTIKQTQKGLKVTSCPDAIGKMIEKVVEMQNGYSPKPQEAIYPTKNMSPTEDMSPAEAKLAKYCPECGSKLEHEGGCVICRSCGYSKCG